MIKIFEKLLNIIYIQPCYFCKSVKDDSIICKKCYGKIHFLPPSVLTEISECDVYACAIYDGIIKKMVRDLKYRNKKKLAKLQAKIMYEYFKSLDIAKDYLIIPVPIHKNRMKERGYNQMDIVGTEFAKLANLNMNKNLLVRIKDTEKQYNLHRNQRIENLKNAFECDENCSIDKKTSILIIDDITSTGATLLEVINTLKKNGYNDITALTLATPDIWN